MSDVPWHIEAAEWLDNDDTSSFDCVGWLHAALEEREELLSRAAEVRAAAFADAAEVCEREGARFSKSNGAMAAHCATYIRAVFKDSGCYSILDERKALRTKVAHAEARVDDLLARLAMSESDRLGAEQARDVALERLAAAGAERR